MTTSNHWNQISKYIIALENNPYVAELKAELEAQKKLKLTQNFKKDYATWIQSLLNSGVFSEKWIDCINEKFPEENLLKFFAGYIETEVDLGNIDKLKSFTSEKCLNEISGNATNHVIESFCPSELNYVTTTGCASINANVDFKLLLDGFIPPENIVERIENKDPIYFDNCVHKVIGCKYGNLPVKGYFSNENLSDFYNCATLNLCLSKTKTCNIKVFNNGQLQLTGVPNPDDGPLIIGLIEKFLKTIPSCARKHNSTGEDEQNYSYQHYSTKMINTGFSYGFGINRETLYEILLKRYKINAVSDSEGYPGVRIHYYYHKSTLGTQYESLCKCNPKCKGKGTGEEGDCCRKLSIAIFQSGKAIIAGGVSTKEPLLCAYNFINNIVKEIMSEIRKNLVAPVEKKPKKKKAVNLSIEKIANYSLYDKLLNLKI